MGKRKLCGTSFWQCDWTGIPMKAAHCYLPTWGAANKLVRKGSYCNWESVVAHAAWLLEKELLLPEDYAKAIQHIEHHTGTIVTPAPHYEELVHTKGRMTLEEFHRACSRQQHPVCALKIPATGEPFEVLLHPDPSSADTGRILFADYLHKPFSYHGPPSSFHSVRKKGKGVIERDLCVFYYPAKDLPHNVMASNLFKMQLYGDVLLVQQSREACFLPRERYIGFTRAQFDEQFAKKRKKPDPQSMTMEGYEAVKTEMQAQLNALEGKVTASAVPPKEMSKAQTSAPTSGASLAEKVKQRMAVEASHVPAIPPSVLAH